MRNLTWTLCLLVTACASRTNPPETPADPLAEQLPVDPEVTIGELPNGLTYYVESNRHPQHRAELRLVVRVGSVVEDDDQVGLAHVVEHMAFNGTQSFAGNALIHYLESVGVRFGPHLNARTSFDDTIYELQIPTDRPGLLDGGLTILREWAHNLTFDPDEVESERRVVLEEWRRTRGAAGRIRDRALPLLFAGSPYQDRLPIGTEASLLTFERDALIRFYRDWYRPDLMAVVAVGDFDEEAVAQRIVELFSDLTMPDSPRPRPEIDIPDHAETVFGIFTDPEIAASELSIHSRFEEREATTHRFYRDMLVERMAITILNERFADRARAPDSPILGAVFRKQRLTPLEVAHFMGVAVREGRVENALELVATEVRRARELGFSAAELERSRREMMRDMQNYFDERETTDSTVHANEILRVVTTGEAMPGIPYEWELAQRFVPDIDIDDLNGFARELLPEASRVITVVMPDKIGLPPPAESALRAALGRAARADLTPPDTERIQQPLLTSVPPAGRVTDVHTRETLGLQEWTLSNGARIIVKPTDFKTDEILLTAFAPGGHSLADDETFVAAVTAPGVQLLSGLGEHDAAALDKLLAGRRARVHPWIEEDEVGLGGGGARDDLETILQLIHLTFTAPRFDQDAFDRFRSARTESLRNRRSRPEAVFSDEFVRVLWQDHLRHRPWNEETLEQMSLERSEEFFRSQFGDARDFTFVFVGAFELDALRTLVERYIGSLPAGDALSQTSAARQPRDTGARRAPDVVRTVVQKGLEPKSRVRVHFHGPFEDNRERRYLLDSMADVLSIVLREEIREHMGGTYSIRARASTDRHPEPTYGVSVTFEADPDRLFGLTERLFDILRIFRDRPMDGRIIQRLQAQQLRSHETALRDNRFWVGALTEAYRRGEDPTEILSFAERVRSLTPQRVQEAAQRHLRLDSYVQVSLMPQSPSPEVETRAPRSRSGDRLTASLESPAMH